jgi:hypothetical protein
MEDLWLLCGYTDCEESRLTACCCRLIFGSFKNRLFFFGFTGEYTHHTTANFVDPSWWKSRQHKRSDWWWSTSEVLQLFWVLYHMIFTFPSDVSNLSMTMVCSSFINRVFCTFTKDRHNRCLGFMPVCMHMDWLWEWSKSVWSWVFFLQWPRREVCTQARWFCAQAAQNWGHCISKLFFSLFFIYNDTKHINA